MFSWIGLLEASAAGGICIILFSVISQIYGEKYLAKYKKVIWLLIALRLCIPISFSIIPQPVTVKVPVYVLKESNNRQMVEKEIDSNAKESAVVNEVSENDMAKGVNHHGNPSVETATASRQITSQSILVILWGCGFVIVMLYYLLGHIIFYRKMLQGSVDCTDKNILIMVSRLANELGLKEMPEVRLTKDMQTGPFTVGFFHNIIVLPDTDYQEKDLQYIVRHELVHCIDKDTQWKVLFVIINAIHWFNPAVWLMRVLAGQDMELECDEKVLSKASAEERKEYSEVLISCIGKNKADRSVLSTSYVYGVKFIKKRFDNIYHTQKKGGKTAGCFIVAFLAVVSGLIGFQAGRTVYAGSRIDIDCGIELRTDVTGDGRPDQIRVYDDNSVLVTSITLTSADGMEAQFDYDEELWASSYLVSGDLSGNGMADIVLMRISNGMHGSGSVSVLHVIQEQDTGKFVWQEYPNTFIQNPAIDIEQPETFDDIVCLGATVVENNGNHYLRLVALDMVIFDDDTVQCIDCSLQNDGWYIESMQTVEGYNTENKYKELLKNNYFYLSGEDETISAYTEMIEVDETASAKSVETDKKASFLTKLFEGDKTVSSDISKYMQYEDFRGYSALSIFPEKIDETEVIDYLYRYEDTFLDPTAEIYLECRYEEKAYQAEIMRLQGIQAEHDGEVQTIIYDTENFSYPAYVTINGNNHCYEYALLLGDGKIAYIFTQFMKEEEISFPADYLPNAYEKEEKGYSMYIFYKENGDGYAIY